MPFALLTLLLAATLTAPGQQPQLARQASRVFLVAAQDGQVTVQRSTDAGRTFRKASPVLPAGTMSAGMHRGPRVAVTTNALLVALIAGPQGGGKDGDVVLYRSTDDGTTWSKGVVVNDVPGAAREGLHGLAATADGHVVVTWLDLREKGTRIFAAESTDHGATWGPDRLVYASPDGSVCQCCHPSVALDGKDVAVMFRNALKGSRDLYVVRASGGQPFGPARKQGVGTWPLDACPMDGGALALTPEGPVSTWRREDGIFLSTPAMPERQLGIGRDPVLAASPAGLDVAWTTADGILLQRGSATRLIGPGRFASILAFDTHTLVAREHQGRIVVDVIPR